MNYPTQKFTGSSAVLLLNCSLFTVFDIYRDDRKHLTHALEENDPWTLGQDKIGECPPTLRNS